jgi:hypothetical protein
MEDATPVEMGLKTKKATRQKSLREIAFVA